MSSFYNRILSFVQGYYRIEAKGEDLNRLWNMCAFHGVDIFRLTITDRESCVFCVGKKVYPIYEELLKKTCVQSEIRKEVGLPYILRWLSNRLSFFLGMLLAFLLIIFLSRMVWNIEIQGNSGYGTEELLRFLKEKNIVHGMFKNQIICSELSSDMRQAYPNITWVSAKIQGCRLLIHMKENILEEKSLEFIESKPGNLVAEKDGTIVSMITRTGVPKMMVGDSCKAGDVLVEGIVPIYNDNLEVVRYEGVSADADILIQTTYHYYDEFSRKYEKRTKAEVKRDGFLLVGDYWIGDSYENILEYDVDKMRDLQQLYLTRNFSLPIWYGVVTQQSYTIEPETYTTEQAKALAEAHFWRFLRNLEKLGVQICENNVKIDISDATCQMKGTVTVMEHTGKTVFIDSIQQPSQKPAQEE